MTDQKPFGRRSHPQQPRPRAVQTLDLPRPDAKPVSAEIPADQLSAFYKEFSSTRADGRSRESEQTAKRRFKMPWRQLALMASLCFGAASLVLPDTLNNELDWLLYGLMAVSAYVGFGNRILRS
jgi:hypothetical protein